MVPRLSCIALIYVLLSVTINNAVHSFAPNYASRICIELPFTELPCAAQNVPVGGHSSRTAISNTESICHMAVGGYLDNIDTSPSGAQKKVFVIEKPEDLLEFLGQDDRLCVVKVWAKWCKTCKQFDVRWRKLAHQEGDKRDAKGNILEPGRARFAEIEFTANEELCRGLDATILPHILIYKGMIKQDGFKCIPSEFQVLRNKVNEYAADSTSTNANNGGNDKPFMSFEEYVQKNANDVPTEEPVIIDEDDNSSSPVIEPLQVPNNAPDPAMIERLQEEIKTLQVKLDKANTNLVKAHDTAHQLEDKVAETRRDAEKQLSSTSLEMEESLAMARREAADNLEAVRTENSQKFADSEMKHKNEMEKQMFQRELILAEYEADRSSIRKLVRLSFRLVRNRVVCLFRKRRRKFRK